MNAIETNSLTKNYGKNRGIENINIGVKEGEIFGFIGPNGAGKSTLIRILLNFLYPTSGEGTIDGKDIVKESKAIKENIGYVPSEIKYYGKATVKEIIKYAQSFKKDSYTDEEVDALVKDLDIDVNKKMEELSLGNKKKVSVLQALINRPSMIILDEPTSGLDPLMQKKLFKILRDMKAAGATVFFSSHNLTEVESICDRVLIIKEGKLVDLVELKAVKEDLGKIIDIKGNFSKEFIMEISEEIITEIDGMYKIIYKGEINMFVKAISAYDIEELSIKRENLEDMFIEYYEKDVK